MIKKWLKSLVEWLYGEKFVTMPCFSEAQWEATRSLVKHFEAFGGESGEWKRHQVYSKLLKLFPAHSHKDLALLIELVVREDA